MNGDAFISSVENHLFTLAPITKFIVSKQLKDLNMSRETLTPEQAKEFIDRMSGALVMCLGEEGAQLAKKVMIKKLREHAPEYAETVLKAKKE